MFRYAHMDEMDGVQTTFRLKKRTSIKGSDIAALHADLATIRKNRPNDDLPGTDAAIVWERVSNGYRIVDLQLDRFMQALHFVLVHRRPKYSLLRIKMVHVFGKTAPR